MVDEPKKVAGEIIKHTTGIAGHVGSSDEIPDEEELGEMSEEEVIATLQMLHALAASETEKAVDLLNKLADKKTNRG